MLRKLGLATALAVAGLATPTAADTGEEHYVLMMGIGFFPDYIHPAVGDSIRFINQSELPMTATAVDQSWTTGEMQPGDEVVIEVVDGMKQTFENTIEHTVDGEVVEQAPGVIDYYNAPEVALAADGEPLDEAFADD